MEDILQRMVAQRVAAIASLGKVKPLQCWWPRFDLEVILSIRHSTG